MPGAKKTGAVKKATVAAKKPAAKSAAAVKKPAVKKSAAKKPRPENPWTKTVRKWAYDPYEKKKFLLIVNPPLPGGTIPLEDIRAAVRKARNEQAAREAVAVEGEAAG